MLGKREQATLLFSFLLTLLSMEAVNPFLPLYVKSMTHVSPHQLATLSALAISAPMFGMIVFSPIWGRLADQYGSKLMVLRAGIALSVCQLLMAYIHRIDGLIAIRLLQGIFAGFITAMQAYTLDVCEPSERGLLLSRLQSAKSLATALGGALGGLVLSFASFHGLYLLSSMVTLTVTLYFYYALPKSESHLKKVQSSETISWTVPLCFLLLMVLLSQVAKFFPQSVFAFYASTLASKNHLLIGLLYTAPAFAIILCSEISGRLFDNLRRQSFQACVYYLIGLCVFASLVLLLQAHCHKYYAVFMCRMLWGVVLSAMLPALYSLLTEQTSKRGTIIGIANSHAKLGNLLGVMLGAWVSGFVTYNDLFMVMSLLYLLMASTSLLQVMSGRKQLVLAKEVK